MKTRIMAIFIALTFLLSVSIGAAAGQPMTFSDVKATDWFKPYVDVMSEKGICVGYGNSKYGPKDNLQVDQLTKFVVIALGNNLQQVAGQYWATPYINKAKELGLIKDGEFSDYTRKITRGEIARIVARGMKETFPSNLSNYKALIKDFDSNPSEFRESILKVYCKGIVNGYTDGRFGATDNATRGEASKMIINLIDPSERKIPTLPTGTEVVRGYTIPLNPNTKIITDDNCDIMIYINVDKPLDAQFKEARQILSGKFETKTVDTVMAYVEQKKDRKTTLNEKFNVTGYEISVVGGGTSMRIIVYKK